MLMNGDDRVAEFVAGVRWEALPIDVQHKARMCLLDNVGALLAGTPTRISQISAEYAAAAWPGDDATIMLHGKRAKAAGAAFANANAANAIDTDDSARYAYGHAGAQVFPAVLAVAEARDLSGAQLLTGMVVGYEVAHRIGRCWHDHHDVYQACGSWGSVACAAAAAHLMNLTPEQARHALGIADYHAPNLPMMRDIDNPAMVKHGIGWGAMTGITAAELAAHGYTGIPSLLSFEKYADWVNDIGRHYIMVDGVAWKAKGYACCGWAHAASEGAKRIVDQHHIRAEDIACVRVQTFKESTRLGTRLPTTTEEAQFNLAWPVAAILADGEIGPAQTLEHRLSDPVLRDLARRVEVVESEDLNELCRLFEQGDPRGRFASRVTVALKDGQELHSGLVGGGLSFPQAGWDEGVMEEKFRWLAGSVLDEARVTALLDMLWRFDEIPDVRRLTRMVA
jgi:2-methylcitrate dehydratase PrpD